MNKYILIWLFFVTLTTNSQIHYFSDCFKGGIVGDGYTAWITGGISQVNLPIPSGSTIKKAFFFSNIYKWQGNNVPALDKIIEINGQSLVLSEQYSLGNVVYMSTIQSYISTMVVDITNYINSSTSTYSINSFVNISPVETPLYSDFYILVLYENNTFETSCIDVYINDKNSAPIVNYSINAVNPLNLLEHVGLSIHASGICNQQNDWYEVSINGTSIGQIGGQEDNTQVACAGVIGSFYYHEGELFGIGNDTSNSTMYGLDAIANIQPYVSNQVINVGFEYMSNSSPYSNLINQLFLTYTSPCAPFSVSVPNDTTICQGSTLQLNVSGGQSYEWLSPTNSTTGNPVPGLSCTNCPNPLFSADSSMFYTVRIWNNDSCSVVRPVHITVKEPPVLPQLSTVKAQCGLASGSVVIKNPKETGELYILSANGDTLVKPIVMNQNTSQGGLYAGNYTVYFQDSLGCRSGDTLINIASYNNTVADFTATPQSGAAPLTVHIDNISQNAQNYSWLLNGVLQPTPFNSFLSDTSGSYQITLIAWQNDSSCADTATLTVLVYDSLIIGIPNVFTPNGDGINDFFSISTNFPANAQLFIINRWGEEVFSYSGKLTAGDNKLWNGNHVTAGVYFYTLIIDDQASSNCPAGNCQLKKEGFVTVVR